MSSKKETNKPSIKTMLEIKGKVICVFPVPPKTEKYREREIGKDIVYTDLGE